MKALMKTETGRGGVSLVDRSMPTIGCKDVLIKVRMAAICGTDLHIYEWNEWAAANYSVPLPLGHEFCGEVIEIGSGVRRIKVGDRVSAETHMGCGHCFQCKAGRMHTCINLKLFSKLGAGCFSEYTAVPEGMLRVVHPQIPDKYATIMEPLGVSVRAVDDANVSGQDTLIVGCGPIGLFSVAAAKTLGANKIIASDVSTNRLGLALKAGANVIVNPASESLQKKVFAETYGYGVGAVIETSGNASAIQGSFKVMYPGSRMVMVGLPSKPVELDIVKDIVCRETTIIGAYGRRIDQTWLLVEKLLLSGKLNVESLLTHIFSIEQHQEAFEEATARESGKILFKC